MSNITFHSIIAARNTRKWGKYAATRYIMNKTGCNYATALRCRTIALQLDTLL